MKQIIENLVNELYLEWLKTNDRYEEDFESVLNENCPGLKFSLCQPNKGYPGEWILLTDLKTVEL